MLKKAAKRLLKAIWKRIPGTAGSSTQANAQERLNYLELEVSNIRRLLRPVLADTGVGRSTREQTTESFDYQWKNLPTDENLLSNPVFRQSVCSRICEISGLPRDWFAGKKVLDAGCGNGRFSYGLALLGAQVTACDFSQAGLGNLRNETQANGLNISLFRHNLLEPLPIKDQFDLVWSFGVLHHTGDTYRAFGHLVPHVKADGKMFLMLYGEPRPDHPEDYTELYHYERLRRKVRNKPFEEALEILGKDSVVAPQHVHGWFDAVSPTINDLYSFEEITEWLEASGFSDIKRTIEGRNHHLIAHKRAVPQLRVRRSA